MIVAKIPPKQLIYWFSVNNSHIVGPNGFQRRIVPKIFSQRNYVILIKQNCAIPLKCFNEGSPTTARRLLCNIFVTVANCCELIFNQLVFWVISSFILFTNFLVFWIIPHFFPLPAHSLSFFVDSVLVRFFFCHPTPFLPQEGCRFISSMYYLSFSTSLN